MRGKYKRRREARRREAPPQDNVTPPTIDTLKFIAEAALLFVALAVFLVGFLLLAPPY